MRHINDSYPYKPPAMFLQGLRVWDPRFASEPTVYIPMGPFVEFRGLVHRHYIATEQANSYEESPDNAPVAPYALGDVELFD
jgi:hypothetical protein